MDSYEIAFTPSARELLVNLLAWQTENIGEASARRGAERIDAMLEGLIEQPFRYPRLGKHGKLNRFRIATANFHDFVYEVHEDSKQVEVVHIAHERGDPKTLLKVVGNLI